jgi:hypothetical protein
MRIGGRAAREGDDVYAKANVDAERECEARIFEIFNCDAEILGILAGADMQ